MKSNRIFIVDDQYQVAATIQRQVKELGYSDVEMAISAEEVIEKVAARAPDVVLMDIKMPGRLNGIKTAKIIKKGFGVPCVFVTAFSDDEEIVSRARTVSQYDVISKPVEIDRLDKVLNLVFTDVDSYKRAGPRKHVSAFYTMEVPGVVVRHANNAMIVRFDLDGLEEDRVFRWDEISVERSDAPIGTKVIGRTQLVKAPVDPVGVDNGDITREIHKNVEDKYSGTGDEAASPIGREITPDEQTHAEKEWGELRRRTGNSGDKFDER